MCVALPTLPLLTHDCWLAGRWILLDRVLVVMFCFVYSKNSILVALSCVWTLGLNDSKLPACRVLSVIHGRMLGESQLASQPSRSRGGSQNAGWKVIYVNERAHRGQTMQLTGWHGYGHFTLRICCSSHPPTRHRISWQTSCLRAFRPVWYSDDDSRRKLPAIDCISTTVPLNWSGNGFYCHFDLPEQ